MSEEILFFSFLFAYSVSSYLIITTLKTKQTRICHRQTSIVISIYMMQLDSFQFSCQQYSS